MGLTALPYKRIFAASIIAIKALFNKLFTLTRAQFVLILYPLTLHNRFDLRSCNESFLETGVYFVSITFYLFFAPKA